MRNATERLVIRWVHILFGLPLLGYIYGPPEETRQYLPMYRFVFVPVLVLSGLWLWKGHLVKKLLVKKLLAKKAA